MLGRVAVLRNEPDHAADLLDASIALAERIQWLAFLPWPQSFRGEIQLARGDVAGAAQLLQQAFARACRLGDPCWEGMSSRGLALVAEATGDTERAFALLADARVRANRLADPYAWLDAYILDARCELGLRHGHPETRRWIAVLRERASRTGMRGLVERSLLHGAALGDEHDAAAAALLTAAQPATGFPAPVRLLP
jgi:ATP/maltotriose-dependent transcriptional regulator MalT